LTLGAAADRTIGIETPRNTDLRLGILTSGGDAPGMNAVVAGACEYVVKENLPDLRRLLQFQHS